MFQAMKAIGIHFIFINMTKLIPQKVGAVVNINGQPSKTFDILWEMRQKYTLLPYLFLIIGEVLNHVIRHVL
jgi:hypothetical protein